MSPLADWFTAIWLITSQKYVGGIAQGRRRCGAEREFIVVIVVELLDPTGLGCMRLRRVEDVSSASLILFIEYAIDTGSEVCADAWKGYNGLPRQNYRDQAINLSASGDRPAAEGAESDCRHAARQQQSKTEHHLLLEQNGRMTKSFSSANC